MGMNPGDVEQEQQGTRTMLMMGRNLVRLMKLYMGGIIDMVTPVMLPKIGWFVMPRHKDKISLGEWRKSDGKKVEKGEVIANIETAKADLELEAPATGLLFSIKKYKDKVKMKDILGVIVDTVEEFEIFKRQNPSGEVL